MKQTDRQAKELEMLMKKYELELEIINIKEKALKTTYGVEYATAKSMAQELLGTQATALGIPKMASGGFTGKGLGFKDNTGHNVAGIVHSEEFVIPKWMVEKNPELIGLLEAIRTGKQGYADGGLVKSIQGNSSFYKYLTFRNPLQSHEEDIMDIFEGIVGNFKKSSTTKKTYGKLDFLKMFPTIEQTFTGSLDGKDLKKIKVIYNTFAKHMTFKTEDIPDKKTAVDYARIKVAKTSGSATLGGGAKTSGILDGEDLQDLLYLTKSKTYEEAYAKITTPAKGTDTSKSTTKPTTVSNSTTTTSNKNLPKITLDSKVKETKDKVEDTKNVIIDTVKQQNEVVKKQEQVVIKDSKIAEVGKAIATINADERLNYDKMLEAISLELEKMTLKEKLIQAISEKSKLMAESAYDEHLNTSNTTMKFKELYDFKDKMYMNSKELFSLEKSNDETSIMAKQNAINKMMDSYELSKKQIDNSKTLTNDQKELALQELEIVKGKELKLKYDDLEISKLELKNKLTKQQYESTKLTYDTGLSMLESMSKGEGVSFDFMSQKDTAINSLIGKFSDGKEIKSEGYMAIGSVVIGLLNNLQQTAIKGKQAELDYESKILDLRMQGSTTEEEKLEIQRQQVELQKKAIDYQMQAQTGFLGATGATGGALSGTFSGLMSGMATGNPYVAVGATIIGGIQGLITGKKAEKQAEEQKRLLEMQQQMTEYLANVAKYTEQSNKALQSMAQYGSKIGLVGATKQFQTSLGYNPNALTSIGGAGSESGTENYTEKGWYRKRHDEKTLGKKWHWYSWHYGDVQKTRDIIKTASYDLKSFGITTVKQVDELNEIADVRAKIQAELDKEKAKGSSDLQVQANIEALEQLLTTYNNTFSTIEMMAKHVFKQAFGATLQEIKEGDKITGYYADWADTIAGIYDNMISSIASEFYVSGNYASKMFMDGFNSIFVRNSTQMNEMTDKITNLMTKIGDEVAQQGSKNLSSVVSSNMKDVISAVNEYKEAQKLANKTADEFVNIFIDNGGLLSDITSSMSSGMKSVYDTLSSSLSSGDISSIGSTISEQLISGMTTKLLDTEFADTFENLYSSLLNSTETLTLQSMSGLYSAVNSSRVQLEASAQRIEAIKSLFANDNITYTATNEQINYTSGNTKDNTINYYNSFILDSDIAFLENEESIDNLAQVMANALTNVLKNYKN